MEDKIEAFRERVRWERFVCAVLVSFYGLMCAFSPKTWRLLDGVNFLFHEAGHFFFTPFGQFLHFLGGTLGQLFFPVVATVYFALKRQYFSAFVVLFWIAQNCFNISVYAGDAVVTNLPVLEGGTHDWNWMLSRLSLLRYTRIISGLIYLTGFALLCASMAGMFWMSFQEDNEEEVFAREGY